MGKYEAMQKPKDILELPMEAGYYAMVYKTQKHVESEDVFTDDFFAVRLIVANQLQERRVFRFQRSVEGMTDQVLWGYNYRSKSKDPIQLIQTQ